MRALMGLAVLIALAGCGNRNGLHDSYDNRSEGPDEFSVLPSRPLEVPETLNVLPPPIPGGPNRTDATPRADAVLALGGTPNAGAGAPIPAADSALIATATRYGVPQGIRTQLAQEDADFRSRAPGLRLLTRNRYYTLYRPQTLDAYAEQERFSQLGVGVPSASPPPEDRGRLFGLVD